MHIVNIIELITYNLHSCKLQHNLYCRQRETVKKLQIKFQVYFKFGTLLEEKHQYVHLGSPSIQVQVKPHHISYLFRLYRSVPGFRQYKIQ